MRSAPVPDCVSYTIHSYIHANMHTYVHEYIHMYIHTYLHTYMHSYIHANIFTWGPQPPLSDVGLTALFSLGLHQGRTCSTPKSSAYQKDPNPCDEVCTPGHTCIPVRRLGKTSLQGEIQCSGRRPLHWIEPCLASQSVRAVRPIEFQGFIDEATLVFRAGRSVGLGSVGLLDWMQVLHLGLMVGVGEPCLTAQSVRAGRPILF